jgi:D-alanine-D-alanine ligase
MVSTLRGAATVMPLGVKDELAPIRDAVESFKPHVVFNLLEEFHGEAVYDHSVVSYLELLRVPYTGCNPRGLVLARGKDTAKKLVHYHRVPTPASWCSRWDARQAAAAPASAADRQGLIEDA